MTTGTGNFAELLWPGIHDKFGTSYDMFPTLYTRVAQMEQSTKAFEKMQGVTGFGLAAVKGRSRTDDIRSNGHHAPDKGRIL